MAVEMCNECKLKIEVIGTEGINDQEDGILIFRICNVILSIQGRCISDDEFSFPYNCVVDRSIDARDVIDQAQKSGITTFLERELVDYKGKCRIFDHPDLTRP